MSYLVRLDDKEPTPQVRIKDFGLNPLKYEEITPNPAQVIFVGQDLSGTPDLIVPERAKQIEIQAVDLDMRICLDENSTAGPSYGQLYSAGSLPRAVLLSHKQYITVYSTGTVGILWGA